MSEDIDDVLGLAKSTQSELPDNKEMGELSKNVEELISVRERIEKGEELLKDLKKLEQRLSGEIIPSIMDGIGLSEVKTTNGRVVSYKPFYSGKIKPEAEDKAYEWMEANDHGALIKGQMIVNYTRQEREDILNWLEEIKSEGWNADIKLGVHHATLRAFFRELVEDEGVQPPPDLFDVFIGRKTTIK